MKRYHEDFVKKIRSIRKSEKLSFKKIGERFNIPSSTIRNWCYDLPVSKSEVLIIRNAKIRQKLKNSEISVISKIGFIDKDKAKFLAAILYGCEGSKYPSSNAVNFTNSDPCLVLSFLKLLKKSFNLDRNKFSLHLQIHTTHNYKDLKRFWSNLLNLPGTCFIKPTVREPKGKKHRNNYLGTCTLRYRDYRIQLKLIGIFETFVKTVK